MARKVFISVLGTGFYKPCIYGDTGITTRFIQEATLLSIGTKEWGCDDTGIVLLTDFARKTNWEVADNKRLDKVTGTETDYCGLRQRIDALQLPFAVRDIPIPDGKNEGEMWTIFTTLFNELQEGDELYIDLTHAFRYLPMLVLVLTNYAKFLKGVTVKSITYGNWEARDGDRAPIVDLLPIAALQDWTHAAAEYLNNGFAGRIKKLTTDTLKPLLKHEATRTPNLTNIKSFASSIENLSNERILCRGNGIINGKNVGNLIEAANQIEKMTVAPLKPIMEKIVESVTTECNTDIHRCVEAARWCYDKHLYQQAITIIEEGIVTFICNRHGIGINDEKKRGLVNSAFWAINNPNEKLNVSEESIPLIQAIIDDEFATQELAVLFQKVTDQRNDYNHAGFSPKATKNPGDIIKKIKTYIDQTADFFKC